MSGAFDLHPEVVPLNHGSFGAVTRSVLEARSELQARIEADAMGFFTNEYFPGLDRGRTALAAFVGARPEDLVLVRNATEGVATVLAALGLGPDDHILVNDHEYGACVKACRRTAAVDTVKITLPTSPEAVVETLVRAVRHQPRTRLVLLSHVTSPTGLVFPLEACLDALTPLGVEILVDGAHAPGMLDLQLDRLAERGLSFYTANLHKWLCGLRGSGFLWVAESRQDKLRPLVTSHGDGQQWPGRSAFHTRFDWTGTFDPSPFHLLPEVLEAFQGLHPAGAAGVRDHNRELTLWARRHLLAVLGGEAIAPEDMVGSLAAVRLPDDSGPARAHPLSMGGLQSKLHEQGFRVPVSDWPQPPHRLLRVSAHVYNHQGQYEALAETLKELLDREEVQRS